MMKKFNDVFAVEKLKHGVLGINSKRTGDPYGKLIWLRNYQSLAFIPPKGVQFPARALKLIAAFMQRETMRRRFEGRA